MALSIPNQLAQLDAARQIVLSDPSLYPQIVAGILPIIGATSRLEFQRWGAEFLSETFASPMVENKMKEQMAVTCLQTLKELLDSLNSSDSAVVKGIIQASASIYAFIFKYIIDNPSDIPVWNNMAAIKSNILQRWDSATVGIRICCIKFVQRVVQVQTPGAIVDPRRPEKNETSIAMVPRDHTLIPPSRLEPEASGLLDRLLDVFTQDTSDPILVDATLNCLSVLIRSRPSVSNKIVSAILNFNPLKRANSPMTPQLKIQIISMERTTRSMLLNLYRRNETSPLAPKIKQYVDRMAQNRSAIFEDGASRKRGPPPEPTDGLDQSKRRRLGADAPTQQGFPLQPTGPNTLAQLFTLTSDQRLSTFDVRQVPEHFAITIANALLAHVDQSKLEHALNNVRTRLVSLEKTLQPSVLGDDEEDYEPAFAPNEDREQVLNRTDALPPDEVAPPDCEIALGRFKLPQPPPLRPEEAARHGETTVSRVFAMINTVQETGNGRQRNLGLNRLAGGTYDRDAWITIATRLATRGTLQPVDQNAAEAVANETSIVRKDAPSASISSIIRENIFKYVMEDFRLRISTAIAWLNEEWFNDMLQAKAFAASVGTQERRSPPERHYDKWSLRLLESIMPYLDSKDKLLIRFLSEIPTISEAMIERVKSLAKDPERVDLCVKALHYLVLLKPPTRELCLDALEDLAHNYEDAAPAARKVLQKFRPTNFPPPTLKQERPPPVLREEIRDSRSPAAVPSNQAEEIKSPTTGMPVAAAG